MTSHAEVKLQAQVDTNEMSYGDTFTLSVIVESSESFQSGEPRFSQNLNFNLLNKWSDGFVQRSQMIAGPQGMTFEKKFSQTWNYTLSPKKEGSLTLYPMEMDVNGKTLKSNSIQIKVFPAGKSLSKNVKNKPSSNSFYGQNGIPSLDDIQDQEDELLNRMLQQRDQILGQRGVDPQFRTMPENPNEAFFVQVEADKTTVYEGEQITVNWYIYTRGQMETLDRLKFPSLKGFWKEIIEEVPSIQFSEEIVNGIPYRKALLASHALFPIKAGTAIIDEYKIRSRVRLPVQSFGGFSMGKPMEFNKSSQQVKINVLPLPIEGRPSSFTGAVGKFTIQSSIKDNQVKAHEPFILNLQIEGSGNAKGVDLPKIEWPEGLELYESKSDSKYLKNGQSYKNFELTLIPRQTGEIHVPSIELATFDPSTKKYSIIKTEPIRLNVLEGDKNKNLVENFSGSTKENTAILKPILPPSAMSDFHAESSYFDISQFEMFWGVAYLFLFVGLGFYAYMSLFQKSQHLSSFRIFKDKWKMAQKQFEQSQFKIYSAQIVSLYYFCLGASVNEKDTGVDIQKLLVNVNPSLRKNYGERIQKNFENFQLFAFAPEEFTKKELTKDNIGKLSLEAQELMEVILKYSRDYEDSKNEKN